jgi:hypothetical protein
VNIKDETWDGTPLGWALHAWSHAPANPKSERYYDVVDLLLRAGASVQPDWLDGERIVADARMRAVLGRSRSE